MPLGTQTVTGIASLAQSALQPANKNFNKRFPNDLGNPPFNYWMSLSFFTYQRPSMVSPFNDLLQQSFLDDQGTIRLPIPNSLVDHQEQEYDAQSFSSGMVAGVSSNTLALGGEIANPLLAIMYRGPTFKTHNFMWRLAPTNKTESENLNSIINTIKANQLPVYHGVTLGYPNIVQVTLSCLTTQYFSYSFKPAIIKSFEVNYAPEGQPSFFGSADTQDAAPTVVEIRMGLTEIEYWTQSDFTGL